MATVTVRIPTPLRSFTGGEGELSIEGETVAEVMTALGEAHDGLSGRIVEVDGRLRNFVNLFVGEENIRSLDGMRTAVREGDVLSIVPAVAGGGV